MKMAKTGEAEVKEITDAEFESAVKKSNLLFVDFFAEWCMPCVMLVPVIEELAETFKGKVDFVKINVDENQASSQKFKIMSIPTLVLFKKGEVVERISGAQSYEALKEKIEGHL
jgi:thioredoxin 1